MIEHIEYLETLKEHEFVELVLIPMFLHMNFSIRDRQGSNEQGKDLILVQESPLGTTYYSVIVKAVSITGNAQSGIHNVLNQIEQSFEQPFYTPASKTEVFMEKVIVVTSKNITDPAKEIINHNSRFPKGVVSFMDNADVVNYILKNCPEILVSNKVNKKYCKLIYDENLYIKHMRSLKGGKIINLQEIFTAGEVIVESNPTGRSLSINDLLNEDKAGLNIVIIDLPGKGKTTSIQKLILDSVTDENGNCLAAPNDLIISFHLPHLPPSKLGSLDTFLVLLREYLETYSCPQSFDVFTKEGIVAFDGFDELETDTLRSNLCERIRELKDLYPNLRIVLTTRPTHRPNIAQCKFYRMKQFSKKDIVKFYDNWFSSNPSQAKEITQKLFLSGNNNIETLIATPLGLTIIAILYESGIEFDALASLTDIYSKYVDVMLYEWIEAKGIKPIISKEQSLIVFSTIAYEAQINNVRIFDKTLLIKCLEYVEKNYFSFNSLTKDDVLKYLIEKCGLIIEIGKGEYQFWHLSYQEYLYAYYVYKHDVVIEVNNMIIDKKKNNSAIFYAGLKKDISGIYKKYNKKLMVLEKVPLLCSLISEATLTPTPIKEKILRQLIKRYGDHGSTGLWEGYFFGFKNIIIELLNKDDDLIKDLSILPSLIESISSPLSKESQLITKYAMRYSKSNPSAAVIALARLGTELSTKEAFEIYHNEDCIDIAEKPLSYTWLNDLAPYKLIKDKLLLDSQIHRLSLYFSDGLTYADISSVFEICDDAHDKDWVDKYLSEKVKCLFINEKNLTFFIGKLVTNRYVNFLPKTAKNICAEYSRLTVPYEEDLNKWKKEKIELEELINRKYIDEKKYGTAKAKIKNIGRKNFNILKQKELKKLIENKPKEPKILSISTDISQLESLISSY